MLTIIITTYNRPDMIRLCCASLQQQDGLGEMEVIVVNNGELNQLVAIANQFSNFKFIHEPRRGLSLARNTGAKEAQGDYLVFLDDDIQLPAGFMLTAQAVADSKAYDCFGGGYRPWYPYGKPKWLDSGFGAKQDLRPDRGPIIPGQDGFLSGGVFACRKAVFGELGGFAQHLGMQQKMGYGEEDDLQLRLYQAGYSIGYIPDWWLEHAVLPHKWRLRWQLSSALARRRDRATSKVTSLGSLIIGSLRTLIASLFKLPLLLIRWIGNPKYYWQNVVLDIGIPLARWIGNWQAFFEGRGAGGEERGD